MRSAIGDLEEITKRISRDDTELAERLGNRLIDKALSLGRFSHKGRMAPEFGDATIREIGHPPYRIIYRLRPTLGRLHILRFWHASRGKPPL